MLKAISAHSCKNQSEAIAADLVTQANSKLGIYRPSAGIFYASGRQDPEDLTRILQSIGQAFPGLDIIGGTVTGGFTADSGYIKDGYFLCLLVSDTTFFSAACLPDVSALTASNILGNSLQSLLKHDRNKKNFTVCLFYSPYNNIDGASLIDTLSEELPKDCLIAGGMTTAYWSEQDLALFSTRTPPTDKTLTFLLKDGEVIVSDNNLVLLLFHSDVAVRSCVSYGWSDIGMQYPGKAKGTVISEIEGKDPCLFFKEMQHPLSADGYNNAEYALWFHVPGKDPFIRDIFFDRENNQFFTRGASLPSHFAISFSFPNKIKIFEEFQNCLKDLAGQHDLVLAITCCTHQVVLQDAIRKEHAAMAEQFPQATILGAYVFGEYGPSLNGNGNILHSSSSVFLALGERPHNSLHIANQAAQDFLGATLEEQGKEIASLRKQIQFLEGSKSNKMKMFLEDCLGMLLCRSHKSISSIGEQLSKSLKEHYGKMRVEPNYAISRNRVIEQLMQVKRRGEEILGNSSDE